MAVSPTRTSTTNAYPTTTSRNRSLSPTQEGPILSPKDPFTFPFYTSNSQQISTSSSFPSTSVMSSSSPTPQQQQQQQPNAVQTSSSFPFTTTTSSSLLASPSTKKSAALMFDPLMTKSTNTNGVNNTNNNDSHSHKSRSMDGDDFSNCLPYLTSPLASVHKSTVSPNASTSTSAKSNHHDLQDSSEMDDHAATLGTKKKHSEIKNHRRWNSLGDSASIRSTLMKKTNSIRGSKNVPATQNAKTTMTLSSSQDGNSMSNNNSPNKTIPPEIIPPPPIIMSNIHPNNQFSPTNNGPPKSHKLDILAPIFNDAPPPTTPRPGSTKNTSFLSKSMPTSLLSDDFQVKLRTCEFEPSPHQIELPSSAKEVLIHARLCALMDDYRIVDPAFDFRQLIGMTRYAMDGFVRSGSTPLTEIPLSAEKHRPIVNTLMGCGDDLVVEGFFCAGQASDIDKRVEVAILRSDTLRQIITVWRGTTDGQTKPVRNREVRSIQGNQLKENMLPSFHQAYFGDNVERQLFSRLEKLMEENPFFDLVTTGFSQGAALATICASRYASLYPMMRVSCTVFGCPKIGDETWRNNIHSLPNLKIIRIQTDDDPFVVLPSENFFVQVGHTILLTTHNPSNEKPSKLRSISPSSSPRYASPKHGSRHKNAEMMALAYKFDKSSHSKQGFFKIKKVHPHGKKTYSNHGIHVYINTLIQFTELPNKRWVTEYVGENVGFGVKGMKDENRSMV